jgi:hypothetical protein
MGAAVWIPDDQVQALRGSCSPGRKMGCDNPTFAVHLGTPAASFTAAAIAGDAPKTGTSHALVPPTFQ